MAKNGIKSIVEPDVDNDGTIFPKYVRSNKSVQGTKRFKNAIKLIKSDTIPGNSQYMEVMNLAMEKTF